MKKRNLDFTTCSFTCYEKQWFILFLGLLNYSIVSFGQQSTLCENIAVSGFFVEDPNVDFNQGIKIELLNAPNKIIRIYNGNWQRLTECTSNCGDIFYYDTDAGDYIVQVQLFNEDWGWICQTENLMVQVPAEPINPPSECGLDILSANFPAVVQPGQTISVEATVLNNSTTAIQNSSIGLYQFKGGSKSPPFPTNLAGEAPIHYLAPGEVKTFYFSAVLPDPFWNIPTLPIGDESLSNNYALITKENLTITRAYKCNFPIDFQIDYPDGDLALSLENNQGCIDEEGFLLTDLRFSNVGGTTVKAPIYIQLDPNCSFGNPEVVTCLVHVAAFRAFFILNEDLKPNESVLIPRPYKLPNTAIESWTISPSISALGSAYEDQNVSNNEVAASFRKTGDCGQIRTDCEDIGITGVLEEAFQGIRIERPLARTNMDYKIYNGHRELLIATGGGTNTQINYPTDTGKYFVEAALYTIPRIFGEERQLICQTDLWEISVPNRTNTPDCNQIEVTATPSGELGGTIQIGNLNAPIEIVKIYNERWNLVYECNANCEDFIIWPAEVGKYYIQIQMYEADWQWICQTENIEVTVELNTDCAANLLRDEDGDGVCEGEDCNDNDPNIGGQQPQGTPCDDGNSNTKNDVIQTDGCTCKGTPIGGEPDCNSVVAKYQTGLQGTYEGLGVENLNASIEIVKIYDVNWNRVFECFADCSNPVVIPNRDLLSHKYYVHVQMYTENWEWICETDFLEINIPDNVNNSRAANSHNLDDFKVFPNPVSRSLHFQTTNLKGHTGTIRIFNIFGKLISELPNQQFNQDITSIDVHNFENGLYYLNIQAENRRVVSKKFIVESLR